MQPITKAEQLIIEGALLLQSLKKAPIGDVHMIKYDDRLKLIAVLDQFDALIKENRELRSTLRDVKKRLREARQRINDGKLQKLKTAKVQP